MLLRQQTLPILWVGCVHLAWSQVAWEKNRARFQNVEEKSPLGLCFAANSRSEAGQPSPESLLAALLTEVFVYISYQSWNLKRLYKPALCIREAYLC